jgi:acetyltransferase-like isoleucine patch superfamily enzyme
MAQNADLMDRKKALEDKASESKTYADLEALHAALSAAFREDFDRNLPFTEELFDRWDKARQLNWGEDTNIYESSYVYGQPEVGKKVWIGPMTIIDGTGGLKIGDHVTVSAGVHIYTHNNIKQTLSSGKLAIEHGPIVIGDATYIGPQSIITMGVEIGKHCLIGANSMVTKSFPDFAIIAGNPAKQIGKVVFEGEDIRFDYSNRD